MSELKKHKNKSLKNGRCKDGCCKPPPFNFDNGSLYCGFVEPIANGENDDSLKINPSNPKEVISKPLEKPETFPVSIGTDVTDQNQQDSNNNLGNDNVENTPENTPENNNENNAVKSNAVKSNAVKSNAVKSNAVKSNSTNSKVEIQSQQILKPKPILNIEAKSSTHLPFDENKCEGDCCANIGAGESCTDVNCSGCDGNHDSNVRNTFLGIAGVLILAMIGYQSFIKMKAKRSKTSKNSGSGAIKV